MANREEEAKGIMKRITEAKGDWFKVLGLEIADCTVDKVKLAYKKAVIHLHPDKCKLDGAASAFSEADKAYKNLKDPETLAKFQKAAQKKTEETAFNQNKSSLEQWLKKSKGGAAAPEQANAMATELSAEEREKAAAEKQRREFIYATERKIKEKQERMKKKERDREDDLYEQARLQDSVSQWKNFQSNGAKRAKLAPGVRQNLGAVRTASDIKAAEEPKADYKQVRKSWQDATR
eukprot:TRINITY_DN547_c1_g1_i1.p1 TRINITY_DN547_c1_g1~~TRINITY_DN547_c1_g1_i1.p1  ORF type:complete len:263 (+),score=136.15 TRINITY_DN547_c1_g1_i1:85-789(+)